jgi:hypothetical protein
MIKKSLFKVGRPTKYKPRFCKDIIDYFDQPITKEIVVKKFDLKSEKEYKEYKIVPNDLPTIEGFACLVGVDTTTIIEWVHKHKQFSLAYRQAKQLQMNIWQTNSFSGGYNPQFTIFAGKNIFGWRDKSETDITSGGQPLNVNVVSYKNLKKDEKK